jgi:hypothetical protein
MIEADTVLMLFLDNPLHYMVHAKELFFRQVTLEHAELTALTKFFETFWIQFRRLSSWMS